MKKLIYRVFTLSLVVLFLLTACKNQNEIIQKISVRGILHKGFKTSVEESAFLSESEKNRKEDVERFDKERLLYSAKIVEDRDEKMLIPPGNVKQFAGKEFTIVNYLPNVIDKSQKEDNGAKFESKNGCWYYNGKPFFISTGWGTFFRFREKGDLKCLEQAKEVGMTCIDDWVRGSWLWDGKKWNFDTWDKYTEEIAKLGLKTSLTIDFSACRFPREFVLKHGWRVCTEEGEEFFLDYEGLYKETDLELNDPRLREVHQGQIIGDPYVFQNEPIYDPSFMKTLKGFITVVVNHFKDDPHLLYWNLMGEIWGYKPYYKKHVGMMETGYDEFNRKAFREWLQKKYSLVRLSDRWGAESAYRDWAEVEPPIRYKPNQDFKGRALTNWDAAWWDWHCFKLESMTRFVRTVTGWIKALDDHHHPIIDEFNTGLAGYYDGWNKETRWNYLTGPKGVDHLGVQNFNETARCNMFYLACARGASDPPHQLNEIAGDPASYYMYSRDDRSPMSEYPVKYVRRTFWTAQAMGAIGMNVWDLKGDGLSIIREDGTKKPTWYEYKAINEEVARIGDRLSGSTPFTPGIGILTLDETSLRLPDKQSKLAIRIIKALLDGQYMCESAIVTEKELADGKVGNYSVLFAPCVPYISRENANKLRDYVKAGGTLVLGPGAGRYNQLGKAYGCMIEPLVEATGVKPSPLSIPEFGTHDMCWQKNFGIVKAGANVRGDYLERLTLKADSVEVLAEYGWQTKLPVVTRHRFGQGQCIYLGTQLGIDENIFPAFVQSVPREAGLDPLIYVTSSEGRRIDGQVYAGIRQREDGYLLILIEVGDRKHDLKIKLNAGRLKFNPGEAWIIGNCLEDEEMEISEATDWSFNTALDVAGVKVFNIIRK